MRSVAGDRRGAKAEVALISVFRAARIKPGIQVRIRNGFFCFVRNHVGHSVSAAAASGNAVRTGGLGFAAVGALVNVSDKRPLDVGSVERLTGVEAAELGTEPALTHVRGSQEQIHAVGISRQSAAGELGGDGRRNPAIPKPRSLGA